MRACARERERGARRLSSFALQCNPLSHTLSLSLTRTAASVCLLACFAAAGTAFQDVASDVDKELNDYRSAMEQINSGGGGGKRSTSSKPSRPSTPPPHALSPLTRTPMRHTQEEVEAVLRLVATHSRTRHARWLRQSTSCPSFKRRSVRVLGTRTVILLFASRLC